MLFSMAWKAYLLAASFLVGSCACGVDHKMLANPRCSTADAPIMLSHAGTSPCSPDVCLRLATLYSSRPCRKCRDFPTAAGSGADPGVRRSQPLHDPTRARTARPRPRAAQARQLLLDPAVAREFERLRGEAEGAGREARGLREELQAAHFSQESKVGRLLMAKCRALQARPPAPGRPGPSPVLPVDIQFKMGQAPLDSL